MIGFSQVRRLLDECGLAYEVLSVGEAAAVVVTQRGGRILGPFFANGESVLWLNKAWGSSEAFPAFLEEDGWNLGGDRVWIAPEIQYHVRDRADFWGTYLLPKAVDPGSYQLSRVGSQRVVLSQDMELDTFNISAGAKHLSLRKTVFPVADPLRFLCKYRELAADLVYGGYAQEFLLRDHNPDAVCSEIWNLLQLNPGGLLIIPVTSEVEYVDYLEPVDADHLSITENHVLLRITGDRQYKVGLKAATVYGRLGYYLESSANEATLIVRTFFNNPSAIYAEEPAHSPGRKGYSVAIYNDDGAFGRFGELECNGQTIGGETGRSESVDTFYLWIYQGARSQVRRITGVLLGYHF